MRLKIFFSRVNRFYLSILEKKRESSFSLFFFWFIKEVIFRLYIQVMLLPAIPIALIILFFRPIWPLRLIKLHSSRIGHYALDTELMLCYLDQKKNKETIKNLYYRSPGVAICNVQLDLMWGRVIPIIPFSFLMYKVDKLLCFFCSSYKKDSFKSIFESAGMNYDYVNLLEKTPPHLSFTKNEVIRAKNKLVNFGMDINSKFICILVRDPSYLSQLFAKPESDFYSHRNADIDNYKKTALYLAEKGYYVFRMGSVVSKEFEVQHPNVVDYANHELQSDFMDIYLASHCEFYISTGTGLDAVAMIFRRPVLLTNLGQLYVYYDLSLFKMLLPKKFINFETKKYLDLKNLLLLLKHFTQDPILSLISVVENLRDQFIDCIENTEDEILTAAQEMLALLNNELFFSPEMRGLQKKFWDQHQEIMVSYGMLPIEMKTIVSPSFLLQNKSILTCGNENISKKEFDNI